MKKLFTLFFVFVVCTLSFAQLSGDYYIPQGSNPQGFTTLAAACSTLTADGASGTVRFLIDDNLAETGADLVISRSDLNATNNLIIKPASGKTPTISITGCTSTSGATQYAGFTLNNTGFVTIDGSNASGGTTRDLTFLMNDATGRDAVNLFGNCDNVTLKNFKVRYNGIQSTTTGRGIYLNGQSTGASDNCVIDNCEIGENSGTLVGPHHGIGYTGSSGSAIYCMNGTISNNLIYANIRGINLFWHNGPGSTMNVYGNTISIMNPASGNVTWGILHQNYTGTTNFYNNRIQTITQKSASTQGIYGFGTLNGVASSGTVTNLYNNFIGGAINHTGTGIPASVDGFSFQDNPANSTVRVYHNTVVMNDFTNKSTTRNTCIRFNPVSTQTFEIRNNIFINNINSSVAYVFHYGGGATLNFTSDYNDVYVSSASAHIGFASSNRTTLSAWSTAFTPNQDVNSVSKPITFAGTIDFHLAGSSVGDPDLLGVGGLFVTTDIDGDARLSPPAGPYMGADEGEIPLPVELSAFSASVKYDAVQLSWKTNTEVNSSLFEIQRKVENAEWTKIGEVTAAGNSNSPKDYSYVDRNLTSGKYLYRLKMIDADGSYQFSKVVEAEITIPTEFSLSQNYPNPFNPTTQINYSLPFDTEVRLDVYTSNGELVRTLVNEVQSAGTHTVEFNASDLASGTYICRMVAKDFVQTRKMILIK